MIRRAGMLAGLAGLLACAELPPGPPERITVPPGATLSAVTDTLAAHQLIGSKLWFRLLARVRGVDRSIQAGTYDVPRGAGAWEVLTTLSKGRVALQRFTAPEGITVLELAGLAESQLDIPADSLELAAQDPDIRARLGLTRETLEGYLLPETYQLPEQIAARELIRAMTDQFERRWDADWESRLDSLGLSRDEVVTLASIVEGEARHDDERPVIAGVYLNRLRIGMALQADPTVQYAIQLKTGVRKTRLYFKDYGFQSPYNTYLNRGLPPGPVNSPGIESIRAVLYPASVPYLYFVARGDGHHIFSRTYQEHVAAIAEVRRLARESRNRQGTGGQRAR